MSHCQKCGGKLDENAKNCPFCGTPVNIPERRVERRPNRVFGLFVGGVFALIIGGIMTYLAYVDKGVRVLLRKENCGRNM